MFDAFNLDENPYQSPLTDFDARCFSGKLRKFNFWEVLGIIGFFISGVMIALAVIRWVQ
jgi:hypothetical protein